MAQDGDTITYTFSDGTSVTEDISAIDEITIEYIDGAGGGGFGNVGSGGRVENVVAEVSDHNNLYIWVAGIDGGLSVGRYSGDGSGQAGVGGGSSEVSLLNTTNADSQTEPFIAGAGGGSGDVGDFGTAFDGARGGNADGTAPPQGGDVSASDTDAEGAVDGHAGTQATITDTGTTIKGGGSGPTTAGEVKLSFQSSLSPPDPPSNLSAEVQ